MNELGIVIGIKDRKKPIENCNRLKAFSEQVHLVLVEQDSFTTVNTVECDQHVFIQTSDIWNKALSNNRGFDAMPDSVDTYMLLDGDLFISEEDIKEIKTLPKDKVFSLQHDKVHGPGNLVIPKEIWRNVGRFNEDLAGWGIDDVDWIYRMNSKGYSIYKHKLKDAFDVEESFSKAKRLDTRPGVTQRENMFINLMLSEYSRGNRDFSSLPQDLEIQWHQQWGDLVNMPWYE